MQCRACLAEIVDTSYFCPLDTDLEKKESLISLKPPYESEAGYTNYFHLAFLVKPDIQRALFIGWHV